LAHRIENCEITSIEIQENLSKIIEKSVKENGFSNKINIINSDIKNIKAKDYANSFDYVLTNPPYSSDKMMASPNKSKATAHNETSVDLRQWLDFSIKMLKPRGCFSMIYRIDRLDEILHILYKKLGRIEVVPLFSKEDKEAKRVVIRGRKSTKTPFCLKKGIVIHQNDGQYTKKAQEILIEAKSLL
jgi:tRNA1(Val) A37 N6-methylase TrmN6